MVFKKSLVPAGPVTRTITGPIFGLAANSNVKKGQHSRSATINSATTAIHFLSPGTRKAYPSGSSSVAIRADLNWARSVASRLCNSASDKQQAIGMASDILELSFLSEVCSFRFSDRYQNPLSRRLL